MKKIIKVIIAILSLTALLSVSIFAVNVDSYTQKYKESEIIIEFSNNNLTKLEQAQIVDLLIEGEQVMAANVICTLFGHSMEGAGILTATHHNVYSSAPKCRIDTYSISECTRCGYVSTSLIGSCSSSCCS